jgi:multidrug efflux pump subunit AcrB
MNDAFEQAGRHRTDLLGIFANHRVAANLLMVIMLLVGALALHKLNVQFFPNFELETITVNTIWSGASAEDIQTGITIPLEQRLRNVDNLKEMTSSSAPGVSGISLEFDEGTDIILALDQVKKQVDDFVSLPQDAEEPKVSQRVRYESVARLLVSGPDDLGELRHLARQFEQELLAKGIDKISFEGLPEESIEIRIASEQLRQLGLSLSQIGERIDELSQDLPAGLIGENDGTRELRSLNQRREPIQFGDLPIVSNEGQRIDLGAIAEVARKPKQDPATMVERDNPDPAGEHRGHSVQRTLGADQAAHHVAGNQRGRWSAAGAGDPLSVPLGPGRLLGCRRHPGLFHGHPGGALRHGRQHQYGQSVRPDHGPGHYRGRCDCGRGGRSGPLRHG